MVEVSASARALGEGLEQPAGFCQADWSLAVNGVGVLQDHPRDVQYPKCHRMG